MRWIGYDKYYYATKGGNKLLNLITVVKFFWLYKNCKIQFMKGEAIEGFTNYKYDKYYNKYTDGNLYS